MDFNESEIREFIEESEELLEQAEQALLRIDKGESPIEHYDALFRAFHSIKGAAGMMERKTLQHHMHQLENLLTEKRGGATLEKAVADYFLAGVDIARKMIREEAVAEQGPPPSGKILTSSPIAPSKTAPKPAVSGPEISVSNESVGKILIIDDEDGIIELVVSLLNENGLVAKGCTDSAKAIALIEEFRPSIVLLDIKMPKMDGIQLLGEIRKKWKDLPVVFLSGTVTKATLLEGIKLGVHSVLEKPFTETDLIKVTMDAVKWGEMNALLNSSINILIYQFSDLITFLKSQGKDDLGKVIEVGIKKIIEGRRRIRNMSSRG